MLYEELIWAFVLYFELYIVEPIFKSEVDEMQLKQMKRRLSQPYLIRTFSWVNSFLFHQVSILFHIVGPPVGPGQPRICLDLCRVNFILFYVPQLKERWERKLTLKFCPNVVWQEKSQFPNASETTDLAARRTKKLMGDYFSCSLVVEGCCWKTCRSKEKRFSDTLIVVITSF